MRVFVAVEIDPKLFPVFERASEALRATGVDAKWTIRSQWHVTLKFLGDVADAQLPVVCDAVRRAASASFRGPLRLAGLGNFGGSSPRVLFARVDDSSGALIRAAANLERELRPLGFPPEERALQPHVTLGRVKSPRPAPALLAAVKSTPAAGECEARELVLFSSELKPSGAEYTPALRAPLGATEVDDSRSGGRL